MAFPFNPSGTLGSNQVTGEVQAKVPPAGNSPVKYNYLIPRYAPYFLETLTVSITPDAKSFAPYTLNQPIELVMGKDYFPVLHFEGASVKCGKEIYGGIRFVDPELEGEVTISYMSLGGTWTITDLQRSQLINAQVVNPSVVDWETATAKTDIFPEYEFSYNLREQTTLASVSAVFASIATALDSPITTYSAIGYNEHLTDYANPHGCTAAKLGLGNVPNWKLATVAESRAGANYSVFVTPSGAYQAITFGTVVPAYSSTVFGLTKLNVGFGGGADNDNFAITTAGLLAYKNDSANNAINTLFEYERQTVYFTPTPITYPAICLGATCRNFRDLLDAVEAHLKFKPIQGSSKRYCIWLPKSMATPDLSWTPA